MDFSISQEQRDLLDRLDEFCEVNLREPSIQQWLRDGSVPSSLVLDYYREFGHIGLHAHPEDEPVPILTRVLVLERLGRHAGATLPFQGMMLDSQILAKIGSERQIGLMRSALLETGRPGFSLAITEPQSGSDSLNAETVATEEGDGFVINGVKSFVSSGQYSPFTVVLAHDASLESEARFKHRPLTFFLVSQEDEGFDAITVPKLGQHLIPTAEIVLDNVRVGKDAVMGERGRAADVLLQSYEYGRLYVCATTVGMAQAAFDQAVSYALDRTVAGSPILSFQQIQEMIVDAQVKIDAMRAMLYKTACRLDEKSEHTRLETALLKRFVPRTAMEVADSAMQIMGSVGYMSPTRAARVWQECRGNRIAEGTDQVMTVIAAKRITRRAETPSTRGKLDPWAF